MSRTNRIGVVAGTAGDLAQLERALLLLADRHHVRRVLPVGEAVADARTLVRDRARRFPEERAWTDAGYADFVLHAVLEGVAATPTTAEDAARTRRLRALLADVEVGEPPVRVRVGAQDVAFVGGGAAPPEDVGLWVSAVVGAPAVLRPGGEPPCLRPGRLAGALGPGDPPACAIVDAVADGLTVTFVGLDGQVLGTERI